VSPVTSKRFFRRPTMATRLASIREKLAVWSKNNKRKFPWRKNTLPYNVMVAEILLQQTFARKIVPVFKQIIQNYPTVYDLAGASPADIERTIKPLGLLYRAKVLVEASKQITREFGGTFPQTKEELLKVRGIGNYISSAILCYSYKQKLIPIDTNVERIICRVFGLEYPAKTSKISNKVNHICEDLVSTVGNTRTLNYAMLDFAAAICKFYKPLCGSCILHHICDYAI